MLGGNPSPNATNPAGNPVNFREVRFPGVQGDCSACHEGDSFALPIPTGLLPTIEQVRTCTEAVSRDTNDFCETAYWEVSERIEIPATTAACTGCHDTPAASAHASVNTTAAGEESCAVCHGPGSAYDVSTVHPLIAR